MAGDESAMSTSTRLSRRAARGAARKLARGAPFAYAVGCTAFRHLNLLVDERVLIPRPETEVLVGEILKRMEASFGMGEIVGNGYRRRDRLGGNSAVAGY